MAKKKSEFSTATEIDAGTGSIDQIREILFGGVKRSYDDRIDEIELLVERNARGTESSLKLIQTDIDRKFTDEINAVNARLDGLNESLSAVEKSAKEQLESNLQSLLERISDLNDQLDENLKLESEKLQVDTENFRKEMKQAINHLIEEKTERTDLGDLLVELGKRIKQDDALEDNRDAVNGSSADNIAHED